MTGRESTTSPRAIAAAFPLALLVTATSLGGLLLPSSYARETANWAAQAVGQDWVDLLFAVPWLAITGALALRGWRPALPLLAGGYAYTAYQFAIYAFAVHFNALFLVYCAALGVSSFAFAGTAAALTKSEVGEIGARVPVRLTGGFLIAVGALFALLWLADIVPALLHGGTPRSTAEAGAITNPVHVMDLSVVLPAHVACGVSLIRGRPFGRAFAPVLLSFGVLMALSIAGMMVVMRIRGEAAELPVVAAMITVSAASAAIMVVYLRRLRQAYG
jgi:hypothetical protein